VISWLEANIANLKVTAVGHRVVLGGTPFRFARADRR
jgi:acetate kinase